MNAAAARPFPSVMRPFCLVRTADQWLRCAHEHTALDRKAGIVSLEWEESRTSGAGQPKVAAGLAFDAACGLYHSLPDDGRVERLLWAAYDPLHPQPEGADTVDVFAPAPAEPPSSDFTPLEDRPGVLEMPLGLAVDAADRLYVAEAGANAILIYDLKARRLLRRVALAPQSAAGPKPLDLAAHGFTVYAVVQDPPGLLRLSALSDPTPLPLPACVVAPRRVAVDRSGRVFLLDRARQADARVVPIDRPEDGFDVRDDDHPDFVATDIEFDGEGLLVVAGLPGADFLRYEVQAVGRPSRPAQNPLLRAGRYDGLGIVRCPDGRIAFWTERGLRHALPARLRYAREGRVVTFRLDSGSYQTVWGRLFVEACIPAGTQIRVHCIATDDPPDGPTVPPQLPANIAAGPDVPPHADQTPPLPPLALALGQDRPAPQLILRRDTGRELPWSRPSADDPFETYETPILGAVEPPQPAVGRYLWLTLDLAGDTRSTPRVKALRAERPGHDLLRRLPRVFSREEQPASFLQRYLAPLEGALLELEARAAGRRALLDPYASPAELLPWLASFLGLVIDDRWTEPVRRTLIAEAMALFRQRGTLSGLKRFIEICIDLPIVIVEHYRLRGLGGAILGAPQSVAFANAVVGFGFRVGGAVGQTDEAPLDRSPADAFRTHAHRFSVIVLGTLTVEQREMLGDLLDAHRPAHTLVDVCTVESGMRIGLGLHLGLSSLVGPSGGFVPLYTGRAPLGRGAILGRPTSGMRVGRAVGGLASEWVSAGALGSAAASSADEVASAGQWRPQP